MKKILIFLFSFFALYGVGFATVSGTNNSVSYTCTGTTGPYTFSFPVYEATDLSVIQTYISTGTVTPITSGYYTVTPVNNDYMNGGSLTLTNTCVSGNTLTITRATAETQAQSFTDGMPALYESFESGLDKLTMMIQDRLVGTVGPQGPQGPQGLTGGPNYDVDALATYGGGTSFTQATIAAALSAIGTTTKATLLLAPGTWVISSNADWSAYTNIIFKLPNGAVISHGAFTLKIPNLNAGLYQVFSGAGLVTLSSVVTVYPEWFGSPVTDVQINQAIQSSPASNAPTTPVTQGSPVFLSNAYTISNPILLNREGVSLKADTITGATLNVSTDINPILVSAKLVEVDNIIISSSNVSPTKAGLALIDGAIQDRFSNIAVYGFAYSVALYSATSAGVFNNEFVGLDAEGATIYSVWISEGLGTQGWVNENHFSGGEYTPAVTGSNVYITGNAFNSPSHNTFTNLSFGGGNSLAFAVHDEGENAFVNCRVEVNGYGIFIDNATGNWGSVSEISGNWYSCKWPHTFVYQGKAHVNADNFSGGVVGGSRVSTTVNNTSSLGQTVLYVASTTGFLVGDKIAIDQGGVRAEWGQVLSIQSGTSLTLVNNLSYTHTLAQADGVEQEELQTGTLYDYPTSGHLTLMVNGNIAITY